MKNLRYACASRSDEECDWRVSVPTSRKCKRQRPQNKNTVWTDSQDHGADEILFTSKNALFHKTTRFRTEISILFKISPLLFLSD